MNFKIDNNRDAFHPTEEHYNIIKKMMLSPVPIEDIFVRKVAACGNLLDRHFEVFTHDALVKMTGMIPDTPAIKGHIKTLDREWGRNYLARLVYEPNSRNDYSFGKDHEYIEVWQYTIRSDEQKDFIMKMVSGIDKAVSIGFCMNIEDMKCSICGKNIWEYDFDTEVFGCPHIPGVKYDNELCYVIIKDINDFFEISNVVVGAQRDAGALDMSKSIDDNKDKSEINIEDIPKSFRSYDYYNKFKDILIAKKQMFLEGKAKMKKENQEKKNVEQKSQEQEQEAQEKAVVEEKETTKQKSDELLSEVLNTVKNNNPAEKLDVLKTVVDELLTNIKELSEKVDNIDLNVISDQLKAYDVKLAESDKKIDKVLAEVKEAVKVDVGQEATKKGLKIQYAELQKALENLGE